MTPRSTRREWLMLCGVGAVTGLAGCSGDGSDDAGNGAQSGDDHENGDAGGDGDESGGNGGGSNEDDQDGTGSDQGAGSATTLNWNPSFVVEMELDSEGAPEITQTVHDGDTHVHAELATGEVLESYRIENETYSVIDGMCLLEEEPAAEDEAPDVEEPDSLGVELTDLETTTIDGESVYIFEPDGDEDGDVTWYVSTETGYPVRFVAPNHTADFHSWGETEPISPPDMTCVEV